jgi:uncharacterized protein
MRLHDEFEWDKGKATANRKKHGITFEFAEVVLRDEEGDVYHADERDDDHSEEEDRHTTFGSHPDDRRIVLRITWTHRGSRKHPITRIISARPATKKEKQAYAQKISGR